MAKKKTKCGAVTSDYDMLNAPEMKREVARLKRHANNVKREIEANKGKRKKEDVRLRKMRKEQLLVLNDRISSLEKDIDTIEKLVSKSLLPFKPITIPQNLTPRRRRELILQRFITLPKKKLKDPISLKGFTLLKDANLRVTNIKRSKYNLKGEKLPKGKYLYYASVYGRKIDPEGYISGKDRNWISGFYFVNVGKNETPKSAFKNRMKSIYRDTINRVKERKKKVKKQEERRARILARQRKAKAKGSIGSTQGQKWWVQVENLGKVYEGTDEKKAREVFDDYRKLSIRGVGKAGNQEIYLFRDDYIAEEIHTKRGLVNIGGLIEKKNIKRKFKGTILQCEMCGDYIAEAGEGVFSTHSGNVCRGCLNELRKDPKWKKKEEEYWDSLT